MFTKPRFRASLDVHAVKSKYLFLLDEHRQSIVEGEAYTLLAPLLDGNHSIADITTALTGKLDMNRMFFALDQLRKSGFVVEGENAPADEHSAFVEYRRRGTATPVGKSLSDLTVSVRAIGGVDSKQLTDAFESSGIRVASDARVEVVLTDDYLRPVLEEVNQEALSKRRPWVLARPAGMSIWLGPVFEPGETGCWDCLRQRLKANRQMEQFILEAKGGNEPIISTQGWLPSTVALACHLLVVQVANWWLDGESSPLRGTLQTIDLRSWRSEGHVLVKRPQCRACGDANYQQNDPAKHVVFVHQSKRFKADGGHRVVTPEQTYAQYKHHVSPILGAVSELRPALGSELSPLTHSYVAGHNFSMGIESVVFLQESLRGMSGGKGSTRIQAMVSGLCEAIERYSGIAWGDEFTIRSSFRELAPKAIHPNEIMGFSAEQFRGRDEWNQTQPPSRVHVIPKEFDPEKLVHWSPIWSLVHQEHRYLPTAFCYYGHSDFAAERWCNPDSNGAAAGNSLEEAFLQGFMELVERDSVALWWYNRIHRRGVDLDSFGLDYLDAIREHYQAIHRELWVLDITSDLGVPTFAAVSKRTDNAVEDVLLGFGAHFDAKIAVLRAVTEVNQFLPSVSLTNKDGSTRYLFGDEVARNWWTTARVEEQTYLLPAAGEPLVLSGELPDQSDDDLLTDVELCIELCRARGFELAVLDQTRPDIGLSVVKVHVPELCHFWRRFGKPRLYDTPVEMGWLDAPRSEAELNPYTIFF